MYKITVKGKNDYQCNPDQTIADALGEDIPYGCKKGGCGKCKVLVLSGDVKHPELNSIAMMPHSTADGYTLACQTKPLSDLELEF